MNLLFPTLALLAIFALPASAAPPQTLSVKDYGAKGDGTTDDTAALNAAIAAGEKLGPGTTVFLPAGRYRTGVGAAKSINISQADGLTVEGQQGTVIVSADLDAPVFSLSDSKNLVVRRLTVDHDPLGYTQGTITQVDVARMTCDVSIDPGYPAPNSPGLDPGHLHPFVFPQQGYYQLDRYWPKPVKMQQTGSHTWHWTLDGPPNIDNWTGKRFFIQGGSQSHGFAMYHLTNATFEDVTYFGGGANAAFYISGLEGTTTFRHFIIGVPPNSGRLYSCAGGGQITGQRGKLVFDRCDFSKIDDDGIDILATWTRILAQKDAQTLIVQQRQDDYRVGDHVEVWDWLHKKMRAAARVTAAARTADKSWMLTLDRDVVTERVGAGKGEAFGIDAIGDGIDRLINTAPVGQETLIRHCRFQVFRAKCLNLKAANCTVEGCTFYDSFQSAVSAAPEWYFEEGPTIRNLIVRDCTFTGCNHYNIDIGATPQTGVPGVDQHAAPPPADIGHDSTHIVIENNTFTGYGTTPSVFAWSSPPGPAIHIANAAHVVVRGNTFGPLSAFASSGTPKILVVNSVDVSVTHNQGVADKSFPPAPKVGQLP